MAQVMLGEEQPLLPFDIGGQRLQLLVQEPLLEQLLAQPERQRHAEGGVALGREGEIGLEQPLEFQEGLVVEGDVIDLLRLQPALFQAVAKRVHREALIMLLAGEALLLCGGDDASVLDQCCRTVMVEGRDADDAHATCLLSQNKV